MKNLPLGRYQKQVLRFAPNDILTYFKENIYETNLCYMGCMPLLGDTECRPLGPFNATLLEQLKNDYQKGEKEVTRYIELQEKVAEKYIKMTPLSVTAKKKLPPSKDPRDYMTLSPYWWPDSTKIDGLPYIRKDGERNPEVYEYPERENANRFGDAAYCLGVLYYITGKEVYAKACANHLRTWFTDPKLGMNPNMTYAQAVPGMKKMRGSGFIDSRRFSRALGVAKLIEGSKSWTPSDKKKLDDWATA
ncbi:MAG: alginate lyase family protein, partial [Bacteroides xylanisolvens]